MVTTGTAPIDRTEAVKRIADHLADRDAYVVVAPPNAVEALGYCLKHIPSWTAYIDNGTPVVLRTDLADALLVVDMLLPTAAVVTVPKTVPATALTQALGQEVPTDGSKDIVFLAAPESDEPTIFPLLFLDALAVVDPRLAAQIHASNLANLS